MIIEDGTFKLFWIGTTNSRLKWFYTKSGNCQSFVSHDDKKLVTNPLCLNTIENIIAIDNRKHSSQFSSTWIRT